MVQVVNTQTDEPTMEQIEALKEQYIEKLRELFDQLCDGELSQGLGLVGNAPDLQSTVQHPPEEAPE